MVYHKDGACESLVLDPAHQEFFVTQAARLSTFRQPSILKIAEQELCKRAISDQKPLLICVDSITWRTELA